MPLSGLTYIIQTGSVALRKVVRWTLSGETLRGVKWCLPCCFVKFGEYYLTAAMREVREETNLRVEIKVIVSVVTNTFTPQVHSLVIVLLSHLLDGDIRGGDDADLAA